MPIYALGDRTPTIDSDAYVHPDAVVIGSVILGPGSSVWPGAVLRGDAGYIEVGAESNVQDGTIIHCTDKHPTIIGAGSAVGHNAHIEGAVIGRGCLIASGSVVLNGSVIEDGSVVGAGAVIPYGFVVPARRMALGVPAKIRPNYVVAEDNLVGNIAKYVAFGSNYRSALVRLD